MLIIKPSGFIECLLRHSFWLFLFYDHCLRLYYLLIKHNSFSIIIYFISYLFFILYNIIS
uniref:Uncharacterized protein n=1 Tax=Podoviridae sp. ctuQh21 TaxID=2825284 RepID=A0A8S5PEQ1_9CAUD|nr:MAG TPA: hypothetical protein [Podoviridae sp. ctuQh21]